MGEFPRLTKSDGIGAFVASEPSIVERATMWTPLYKVRANSPYISEHHMDLSFSEGELIDVLGIESNEWLNGCTGQGNFGSFPKHYVDELPRNLIQPSLHPETNAHDSGVTTQSVLPTRPSTRPTVPVATRPTSHLTAAPKAVPALPPRNNVQPPATPPRPRLSSTAMPNKAAVGIGRYIPNDTPDVIDRLRYVKERYH